MLNAVAVAIIYFLAHQLGFYLRLPPGLAATVWVSPGFALGVMLAAQRRQRVPFAVALAVATLSSTLISGLGWVASFAFLLVSVMEIAVAWYVASSGGRLIPTMRNVSDVVALILASLLSALLGAAAGGFVIWERFHGDWVGSAVAWFASDALGILLITPLLLTVFEGTRRLWSPAGRRDVEALAFLVLWTLATLTVFDVGGRFGPPIYTLVALLTWAGLRLGPGVVSVALVLLGAVASTSPGLVTGASPLGGDTMSARMLAAQAYIGVTATMGLLLAASRRETEVALGEARETATRMQALTDNLRDGAVMQLQTGHGGPRILYASAGASAITGLSSERLLVEATAFLDQFRTDAGEQDPRIRHALSGQPEATRLEGWLHRSDGTRCRVVLALAPRRVGASRVVWDGLLLDETASYAAQQRAQAAEARLQEAERLKLVGQLAGGIAHEFNNLLTVILGYADQLVHEGPPPATRDALDRIRHAARRAATLTRQMLATGRRTMLVPVAVDLGRVVVSSAPLLRRIVGKGITVSVTSASEPLPTRFDPRQFERVLLSFAENARDAMPDGGTLSLAMDALDVDVAAAERNDTDEGRYACLTVRDTGIGMSPDVKRRLFEPFFSTKGVGHGTGLGLSASEGLIRQSGGFIEVDSEPGQGSAFRVFLPLHDRPAGVTGRG